MKNKFSTLFGFAALALLVSGCSKDSVDTAEVLQQDEVRYVSIMIGDAAGFGSRTESVEGDYGTGYDYNGTDDPKFEEGTNAGDYDENKINSLYLLFYDEDDNRVGGSMLVDQSSLFKNITVEEPKYGSVYERRVGIVQINLSKGEKVPDKVVAIINPVASEWASPRFQAGLSKLKDLETLVQEQVVTSRGFAMSNSVYYENESAAAPIVAAKIIGANLYKSEKKAQDALDSVKDGDYSSVLSFDIYVERYAVKVNFSFSLSEEVEGNNEKEAYFVSEVDDDSSFSNDATCTLKFNPEYWWVNAQEPEAYVVKSLFKVESGQTTPSSDYLSYGELNAAINPSTDLWQKWNSPESHRSYWAQSPAYYSKTYPRVSDDIMDDKDGANKDEYDEEGEKIHNPSNYSLKYYTYNEIAGSNDPAYDVPAAGKYAKQYVRENTMASSVLASENLTADKYYNYKAAIPSIVMVGRYAIEREGAETLENETFYVRGSETNDYYVFTEEAMNKLFRLNTEGIVGVKNGNNYEAVPENKFFEYFDMIHPSEATRAKVGTSDELVIDARFVTMQTKKDAADFSGSGIYVRLESGWAEVNGDNIYTLNRMLITTLGLARKFNEGLAYFNIPIKHLRFNLGKKDIIEPTSKEFEWDKVRVGDFGLVRNHIYTINVSSITGLGTGISNPDDPIVPPVDEEEYYAASRVNILNWAVVPTQNVDL